MYDWLSSHKHKYYKYLENHDLVVTAGACGGMHVRFYAQTFKKVYAFEPDPVSFQCMSANNPYPNVYKFNAALSRTNGTLKLNVDDQINIGTHSIGDYGIDVQAISIDALNLRACSLIQLDLEGYEQQAIEGAYRTIDQFSPVIIAERYPKSDILEALGYEMVDVSRADVIYKRTKIPA